MCCAYVHSAQVRRAFKHAVRKNKSDRFLWTGSASCNTVCRYATGRVLIARPIDALWVDAHSVRATLSASRSAAEDTSAIRTNARFHAGT